MPASRYVYIFHSFYLRFYTNYFEIPRQYTIEYGLCQCVGSHSRGSDFTTTYRITAILTISHLLPTILPLERNDMKPEYTRSSVIVGFRVQHNSSLSTERLNTELKSQQQDKHDKVCGE